MPGINGKVPVIEQGVHVRPGQQPVVQTVLTALGHRPDMRCLREPAGGRAGGLVARGGQLLVAFIDRCPGQRFLVSRLR